MIYYFSGTGNSRYVARELSGMTGEDLGFIPDIDAVGETADGLSVGFVFPVYSWGVPPLVLDFISRLPESFWNDVRRLQLPVWCVMTCGDEVALAPEMFEKCVRERGVEVESVWCVIMPNDYVLLPGFDVDPKDVELKKLHDAPARLREIGEGISQHRKVVDVVRGSFPALKTRMIYPLFKRWGIFPDKWRVSSGCVGCGICAKSCPQKNIIMDEGHPRWGKKCCSCLACYHSCPRHCVEYGTKTKRKGQYFFANDD